MPYKHIYWIKLQVRLLNDPRFFLMSDKAQLFYIKLLLLCGSNGNKVTRKWEILSQLLRATGTTEAEGEAVFKEIRSNFPKVLVNNSFYYIKGFKEEHNWVAIPEIPGNSLGNPPDALDKRRIDKIRIEYIRAVGIEEDHLKSDDYGRIHKAIKNLVIKADHKDDLVIAGIHWITEISAGKWSWTLETLLKKWPEFMKWNSMGEIERKYTKK
jgi:hypothetical protein